MNNDVLVTFEILVVIVGPLLFLYLKGKWPLRTTVPCLLALPVVWYLTYSPVHELSHVAGTYLVGGRVVYVKLIPRFWRGEFGRAWITPEGLASTWQQLIMTASPYLLDTACIVAGFFLLRKRPLEKPFVLGFMLMFLCLRPTFDFVCETIAFAQGNQGDLFHIAKVIGSPALWSLMVICIGLSIYSIASSLKQFTEVRKT